MHISWLGNTAVKIQTKPFDQDVIILIDPYKQNKGEFPRNLTAQIVLYTNGKENSITVSADPFTMENPGECETKGVLITGVQGNSPEEIFYRLDAEQISLGHLGSAKKELNDEQTECLSGVDILFLPVGNEECYDAETAVKIANSLEPRIIIPILYKSDNNPNAASVESFLKEIGSASEKADKKLIIKKKDLPQEETKVIVLNKE